MWKKIAFYACSIIIGVSLMFAAVFTIANDRQLKLENKSMANMLRLNKTLADTDELSITCTSQNTDFEVHMFEAAQARKTPYEVAGVIKEKKFLDKEYIVVYKHDTRTKAVLQNAGTQYNSLGFVIENSQGEEFHYYANMYKDGVVSNEEDNKNIYSCYQLEYETLGGYNIFSIPYEFLKNYTSFTAYDVKSVKFIDNRNEVYSTVTPSSVLDYSSEYMNKVSEIIPYWNGAILGNELGSQFNTYKKTWRAEYKLISGAVWEYSPAVVFNGTFWTLSVLTLLIYALFVIVLGDFAVGRRRILVFFQKQFAKDKRKAESIDQEQVITINERAEEKDVVDVTEKAKGDK